MKYFFTMLLLGISLCLSGLPSASANSKVIKRVLVLYTLEKGNAGQDIFDAKLREILSSNEKFDINIYNEYLDLNRFHTQEYISTLTELMDSKYSREKPDVVITVLASAFDFVEHHTGDLFDGIPLIAAVLPRDRAETFARSPFNKKSVALVYADNAHDIAQSALLLRPNTRHVAFIAGSSPLDESFKVRILREIRQAAAGKELIDLSGLTLGEILSRVRMLPPDSIIFFTSVFRDKEGVAFNSPDVLKLISHASNSPVFGFVESHIGKGIIGGRLATLQWQVDKTAEYTQRILAGGQPETPIVTEDRYRSVYDYKELVRWKIPESSLPKGSVLINKEPGFFERYRPYVIAATVILVLQTALIGYLATLYQKQKRMTRQLIDVKSRYAELLRVERTMRLGELTASIAHELNQPLTAILSTAQAALRFLDSGKDDPSLFREILQNIVQDDKRAADIIRSLRSMVKKEDAEKEKLNIVEALSEVVAIIQGELIRSNIYLETLLDAGLPPVLANRGQIQQVMLNLILNAMDSLNHVAHDERTIILKTEKGDGCIRVAVIDNGKGIPPEDLTRVFEPFFTTKGTGMGMGLALCNTIITSYGGRIWAERNPQGGSVFIFELPVADRGR